MEASFSTDLRYLNNLPTTTWASAITWTPSSSTSWPGISPPCPPGARIDGEKAVVTVSTVTPQSSDKALFQRHDAHRAETDLEGSELFEVSLAELTPTKPTDEAADTTVGTAGTSIAGMLCEAGLPVSGRGALQIRPEGPGLRQLKKPCSALSWTRTRMRRKNNRKETFCMGFFAVLAASLFAVFLLLCSAAIRCCSGVSSPCG